MLCAIVDCLEVLCFGRMPVWLVGWFVVLLLLLQRSTTGRTGQADYLQQAGFPFSDDEVGQRLLRLQLVLGA